ncbi:MAG: hypothetical protein ABI361_12835 [Nitrososphaera sp.]|jgi:hypothetical protein
MNIDVNPFAKGSGYKKSASIAIIALLVFGAVGIVAYTPKSAFAAVTITTSSSQFYGPALERVLITDTSKDTATDTIVPHVAVKRGSTSLFEQDITVPIIGTSGTFEFYLTTSNSPFKPASPSFTAGPPIIVRISQTPVINGTTEAAAGFGAIPSEYSFPISSSSAPLKDGDSIIITYGGQTTTVQFAKGNVKASIDRTVAGNGNKVTLTLNDQNGNIDPTAIDSFNATNAIATVVGGTMNLTGAKFIEEGQNNGAFDLVLNVTSSNSGTILNPSNGGRVGSATFPGTAQFTLHGFDVYPTDFPASATAPYNAAIPNPSVTSSQTVTLQNTDGQLTLQNTVNIPNGIAIQINDQDRNIDTKTRDNFTSLVCITMDNVTASATSDNKFCNVPMKETDFNSGVFVPDTTDNKIAIQFTTGDSFFNDNATKGTTGIFLNASTLSQNNNLYIKYTDPAADPNILGKVFQQVTVVSHVVGKVSAPQPTVSLNSKFPLTITDNDQNLNPDTQDSFTITFNSADSSALNPSQFVPTASVGNTASLAALTVKAAGVGVNFGGSPMTVTFVETGANTGVFTANNLDMQIINTAYKTTVPAGLKDGDQVEFKYRDFSERPSQTSTVDITVGNPPVTIDTDRTTIPNPAAPGGQVKFTITVTDQSLNINPSSIDSPLLGPASANPLTVAITKSDGSSLAGSIGGFTSGGNALTPQIYTETGASSGIFTYQYVLDNTGTASIADLNNAKVKFTYTSGGTSSSISVTLKDYDGAVTSSNSIVRNGDNITLTLNDPDLNRDNTIAEQASVTLHTSDDTVSSDTVISNLQETGPNTGIFTKNIQIGKDVKIGDLPTNKFATTLEVHYTDSVASDLSVNVDRELDLKVGTSTGMVTVTPTIVGPGTKVGIDVKDNDLNVNPQGVDLTDPTADYLRITSDATNANVLSTGIQGEETGANTGIFHTKLTLTPAVGTATSGAFSGAGKEIFGTALPGDTISLRYTDQKDASGNKVTVATTFKVQSFDPTFSTDRQTIAAGDSFTLTVSDPDANTDGEAVDSIPIRAYSTSDAVGITLSALETGPNTGNFTVNIPTTTGVSAGSVSVKTGDTLTVKYNDKYPADFATRVKQVADPSKDFFFNTVIGSSSGLGNNNATSVTAPQTQSIAGTQVSQITAGQQVVLATTVQNNNNNAQPFAAIIEVRDSNDVTVSLTFQTGTLNAGGSLNVGSSWTPDTSGTYTVRTFIVTNIATPQLLSQTSTSTVNVV